MSGLYIKAISVLTILNLSVLQVLFINISNSSHKVSKGIPLTDKVSRNSVFAIIDISGISTLSDTTTVFSSHIVQGVSSLSK
jgi:hypothetical protein